jgi:folate-binding protein YgfZ
MNCELNCTALADLGALRIAGADAVRFLQGQLSNDVTRLAPERALLAGYHNPQGRALALLRLVALADGELLALLPRELIAPVSQRLGKVVLRAQVSLADVSGEWRIGAIAPCTALEHGERAAVAPPQLPAPQTGAQCRLGERLYVTVGEAPARWLEIAPGEPLAARETAREEWRLLDIRAGLAQVYAATAEQFVAQMLNLDALDAVAFDKGCYTGQEVIARAHYRGRVKRRAQRFRTRNAVKLAPGDGGVLSDGRAFTVIEAARLPDGRCEFLAVAPLAGAESAAASAAPAVDAEPLELPYALPQ